MRACSHPAISRRHSPLSRSCLQGSGANAPFTTLGGLDNTWVQGRRASRFFINDNLAWSHGAHELRFGTNTRIFRLNDYDFGQGTVPTVTYTTLPQFIYGVASTATETFPTAGKRAVQLSESRPVCAGHLEGDFEADVDLRRSRHAQFQSAESAPADRATAGSFDCHLPRRESAAERRHSDAPGQSVRFHAAGDTAAENGNRMAVCAAIRASSRLRPVQRHPAGQRRGHWSASIRPT